MGHAPSNRPAGSGVEAEMKCYSLLLGARNTRSRTGSFSPRDEDRIRRITFRHFPDGFTVLNADGGWFDPRSRRFVAEQSRQILVCAANSRGLRGWCAELAASLGQEELLVVELGAARRFARAMRTIAPTGAGRARQPAGGGRRRR